MGLFGRAWSRVRETFQSSNDVVARLIPLWRAGKSLPSPYEVLELARLGYVKNPIVGACIKALATSASEPKLEVVRPGRDGDEPVPDTHPEAELLAFPNREQETYDFLHEFLTFYRTAGNAFIHKRRNGQGRIQELWNLRPDRVSIIPGRDGMVAGYEYDVGGTRKLEIPAPDVIHMKEPNPLDDYWGLSRIVQVAMYVDLDNEAAEWLRDFFENRGVVGAILKVKTQSTRPQRREAKEDYLEEFGPGKRGGLAVLGVDAEYQKIGEKPGDELDLGHVWDTSESRICAIMDTPPIVAGLHVGLKHGTYANYREAKSSWWEETLAPLYKQVGGKLTIGLNRDLLGFESGLRVRFNLDTVEALQESLESRHRRAVDGYDKGVLLRSEARELLGYEFDEKVDTVYKTKSGELILPPGAEDEEEEEPDDENPPAVPPPATEEKQHRRRLPAGGSADLPAIVLEDDDTFHVEPRFMQISTGRQGRITHRDGVRFLMEASLLVERELASVAEK